LVTIIRKCPVGGRLQKLWFGLFTWRRCVMNYSKLTEREIRGRGVVALSVSDDLAPSRKNWKISYEFLAPIAMAADALLVILSAVVGCITYHLMVLGTYGNIPQYIGLAAIVTVLLLTLGKNRNLYSPTELLNFKSQIHRITIRWVGILVFLTAVGFAMKVSDSFSRGATTLFAIVGLTGLIGSRVAWRIVLANGLALRNFAGRKVVLLADQAAAVDSGLLETLKRHGIRLAHHFLLPVNFADKAEERAVIAQTISSVRHSDIEEIVIAANLDNWPELCELIAELRILPVPVNLVPVGPRSDLFRLPSHTIGDTITIEVHRGPRTAVERAMVRMIDLLVAGTALVMLLPLLVTIAIAIKLDSAGPIIFRQRRRGFNGREFYIFKFRTMSVLEDGKKVVQAKIKDDRVTRIGTWLRRTSIDELPQLCNVVLGDMSIIGPRPHAVVHDDQFEKLLVKYAFRHHVKPGITGWAQVHGLRGGTQKIADLEERLRLDLWYVDNWSFALDFKILFMTLVEVCRGTNAY
jgi:Undecaprenyl-phosphate glucose phosphotransferase